jgi:exopolysaccharide biosynthesis protein
MVNLIHVTRSLLFFLFILPVWQANAQQNALQEELGQNGWNTEKLQDGLYWHSYLGSNYFDSEQSINLIELVPDRAAAGLKFAWSDSILIRTSEFAQHHEAIAAINGTFFNMELGGTVVFFRVDGETISRGAGTRRLYSESGGIGIREDGSSYIIGRPEEGWLSIDDETVMGSGPLLTLNGEHRNLNNDPFNQNRHPRTAIGETADGRLFLVTVDGRTSEAHGMSTPELREFMEGIGAVSALNLDGGGSTAMWIRDRGENGIVNYPSDNRQFDRRGERGIANVLLLVPVSMN